MKSSESITFHEPLRDARLASTTAPTESARLLKQAEDAAYERGRRDGENALGQQLVSQRAEFLELQKGVLSALRAALPRVSREAEKALVDLAIEAARRIVAGMPIQAKIVEAVVREAVGQIEDTADIVVHLNADDLALLRKHQSPILQGLPETGPIRFAASPDVTRGGCIIYTRFGLIDARRETKIEQLHQALSA